MPFDHWSQGDFSHRLNIVLACWTTFATCTKFMNYGTNRKNKTCEFLLKSLNFIQRIFVLYINVCFVLNAKWIHSQTSTLMQSCCSFNLSTGPIWKFRSHHKLLWHSNKRERSHFIKRDHATVAGYLISN